MSEKLAARCGIYCGACKYREPMKCPGCVEAEGRMFWGECPLAACCVGKGLEHCGKCDEFPCDLLHAFAYHEEQGDDGQRIRNLEAWNAKGFQAWVKERAEA